MDTIFVADLSANSAAFPHFWVGMAPFAELSFMPLALSSGGQTVFNYNGNETPPKDYAAMPVLYSSTSSPDVDRLPGHPGRLFPKSGTRLFREQPACHLYPSAKCRLEAAGFTGGWLEL